MSERKIEVTEYKLKGGKLTVDEEHLVQQLISLSQTKRYRSAWEFLKSNAADDHVRFYNAGVVLQNLSNLYGDIGDLKDECFLQKELDRHSAKVVELLL